MGIKDKLKKLKREDLENILMDLSKKKFNSITWLESEIEKYLGKGVCDSYATRVETVYLYNRYTGQPETATSREVGYCRGTKECDTCSCKGNRNHCDFGYFE